MVWLVHFRVIFVNGNKNCFVVTRHINITRIVWTVRIAKKQILRVGFLLGVFSNDFPREDHLANISERPSAQVHSFCHMLRQPELILAYALSDALNMVTPLLLRHGVQYRNHVKRKQALT